MKKKLIQNSRIASANNMVIKVAFTKTGDLSPIIFRKYHDHHSDATTYQACGDVLLTAMWNSDSTTITVLGKDHLGVESDGEAVDILFEKHPWLSEYCAPGKRVEGRPIPTTVWDPKQDLSYRKKLKTLRSFLKRFPVEVDREDVMITAADRLNYAPVGLKFYPGTYQPVVYTLVDTETSATFEQTETWYGCSGHGHAVRLETSPRVYLTDGEVNVRQEDGRPGIPDWDRYRYLVRVRTRVMWAKNNVSDAKGTAIDTFHTHR